MRITKQALVRRWTLCTVAAVIVFAVLAWSDWRLKALSGVGTADLQGFNTAVEYRWAFLHWPARFAVRAGFDWGLDYLFMPLYAAAFFYSGILTLLSAVPIAGAVLDAIENVLEIDQMLSGTSDALARIAFNVSNAKWMAVTVGLILLAGAVMARLAEGRQKAAKKSAQTDT